jgi:hypothetical protein
MAGQPASPFDFSKGKPDRKHRWPFFIVLVAMLAVPAFILWKTSSPCDGCKSAATEDLEAKQLLLQALDVAKQVATNNGVLSMKNAAGEGPDLVWAGNVPARPGVVSIDLALSASEGPKVIVMSTRSASGDFFCLSFGRRNPTSYGHKDAVGAKGRLDCGTAGSW